MRIVHVTDCYLPRLGGIELQVRDLATRQAARGDDVTIVTSVAGHHADGLDVRRPAPQRAHGSMQFASVPGLLRRIPFAGADVVHVHASSFSPLAFTAAVRAARLTVPVGITVHSLWAYAMPAFRASNLLTGWGHRPIAWSAVSRAAAEPLRRLVSGDVGVVPNGVDEGWWRTESSPRPDVGICSVLRMSRRKRPFALLSMLHAIRRRVPREIPLRATLVGGGPLLGDVRRAIVAGGLDGWVDAVGAADRTEVRRRLADSDIYVAPAVLESFGIAALEARCAGLPVVARADTGVADFVEHGTNGLLVRDDADMAHAVARLAHDTDLRERLRAHNRDVPSGFGWPESMAAADVLYRRARRLADSSRTLGRSDGVGTR